MAACVECREDDSPGRIVEMSYCGHRVCMGFRRRDCREIHTHVCPALCRAIGRVPVPRDVVPAPPASVPAEPEPPRTAPCRKGSAVSQGVLFEAV